MRDNEDNDEGLGNILKCSSCRTLDRSISGAPPLRAIVSQHREAMYVNAANQIFLAFLSRGAAFLFWSLRSVKSCGYL